MSAPTTVPAGAADAERAVLGALLVVGASDEHRLATAVATVLTPKMFGAGAHRAVYEAMEALRGAGVVIDPVTLVHQLEANGTLAAAGGHGFISELIVEVMVTDHALHHARLVREAWKRREVVTLAKRMHQLAADPTVPIDEVFAWASKALLPMAAGDGEKGFRRIKDGLWAAMERIEQRTAGTAVALLPTGLLELDEKLDGGLMRGEFVVVGGVPSCGKTTLVWNLLRELNLCGFGAVGFVSAEMSEGMLLEAALAAEAEVPRAHLKTGKLEAGELSNLAGAAGRLLNQAIYVDDTVMPDIEDVVNRCRLLKVQEPTLAAIGVDFIQLLQKRERDRGELGEAVLRHIAYSLKAIALELNVVVIALAQPNDKQIEERPDKRPQIRDLQGSAGMRQAADHMWMLYRPKMYNPGAPDTIEIHLAKQKSGATATAILQWDGPRLRVVSPRAKALRDKQRAEQEKPLNLLESGK